MLSAYLQELLYFIFVFTLTWCLPLVIMIGCHAAIIALIYRWAVRSADQSETPKLSLCLVWFGCIDADAAMYYRYCNLFIQMTLSLGNIFLTSICFLAILDTLVKTAREEKVLSSVYLQFTPCFDPKMLSPKKFDFTLQKDLNLSIFI